ncbi:MAG: hypothetical protein ABI699_10445 [Caldimonas sp.]
MLVVDGAGYLTNALVGELLMLYARERECVGFVIDGAARDSGAFLRGRLEQSRVRRVLDAPGP